MLACAAAGGGAQQRPASIRSARAGVYTEAQAKTGRDGYALLCRSCHTPGDHSAIIKAKWSGKPLSELFQYIGESMPKSDPGILDARDNADILAFILQTAGLPAGAEPLPANSAALEKIWFDTLATKGARP